MITGRSLPSIFRNELADGRVNSREFSRTYGCAAIFSAILKKKLSSFLEKQDERFSCAMLNDRTHFPSHLSTRRHLRQKRVFSLLSAKHTRTHTETKTRRIYTTLARVGKFDVKLYQPVFSSSDFSKRTSPFKLGGLFGVKGDVLGGGRGS